MPNPDRGRGSNSPKGLAGFRAGNPRALGSALARRPRIDRRLPARAPMSEPTKPPPGNCTPGELAREREVWAPETMLSMKLADNDLPSADGTDGRQKPLPRRKWLSV